MLMLDRSKYLAVSAGAAIGTALLVSVCGTLLYAVGTPAWGLLVALFILVHPVISIVGSLMAAMDAWEHPKTIGDIAFLVAVFAAVSVLSPLLCISFRVIAVFRTHFGNKATLDIIFASAECVPHTHA